MRISRESEAPGVYKPSTLSRRPRGPRRLTAGALPLAAEPGGAPEQGSTRPSPGWGGAGPRPGTGQVHKSRAAAWPAAPLHSRPVIFIKGC